MLRTALAAPLLTAAVIAHSCGASGHAEGVVEWDPPLVPPISAGFTIGKDGGTVSIDGGPPHANKCVDVLWFDAEGNVISSSSISTDGQGSATGSVPPGTDSYLVTVVDCPESDPEGEDDGQDARGGRMFLPASLASTPQTGPQVGSDLAQSTTVGAEEYTIFGGPVIPDDSFGATNTSYYFVVEAASTNQAFTLVEPIIATGPGVSVPPSVRVVHYATVQNTVLGVRMWQAMPGHFLKWDLSVNNGAHYADLNTALVYDVNDWQIVETVVPFDDLDYGVMPGVEYSNEASADFETNLTAGPVDISYSYSYQN